MRTMLIQNDPLVCEFFSQLGGDRIFIDLEKEGKRERQKSINAHFTSHELEDVKKVAARGLSSEIMVRVNPLTDNTLNEVDEVLALGAKRLMLPMFSTIEEVNQFRSIVKERVPITFLAETPDAVKVVETFHSEFSSTDEVHFGLNDLSLCLQVSLFDPLFGGYLDTASKLLKSSGISFGIGGIGDVTDDTLPVSPESILRKYIALGSTWVILSRAFTNGILTGERRLAVLEERIMAFKSLSSRLLQECK